MFPGGPPPGSPAALAAAALQQQPPPSKQDASASASSGEGLRATVHVQVVHGMDSIFSDHVPGYASVSQLTALIAKKTGLKAAQVILGRLPAEEGHPDFFTLSEADALRPHQLMRDVASSKPFVLNYLGDFCKDYRGFVDRRSVLAALAAEDSLEVEEEAPGTRQAAKDDLASFHQSQQSQQSQQQRQHEQQQQKGCPSKEERAAARARVRAKLEQMQLNQPPAPPQLR